MNPNWYCKEVEFRCVRDLDLFEVGCDQCAFRCEVFDRRWPKESYIEFLLEKGCTCE